MSNNGMCTGSKLRMTLSWEHMQFWLHILQLLWNYNVELTLSLSTLLCTFAIILLMIITWLDFGGTMRLISKFSSCLGWVWLWRAASSHYNGVQPHDVAVPAKWRMVLLDPSSQWTVTGTSLYNFRVAVQHLPTWSNELTVLSADGTLFLC